MAKFTAAKIKEQIKKIQQAIDKEKSRYRDQNLKVTEVKPEDIVRKLRRMKISHDRPPSMDQFGACGRNDHLHCRVLEP